MTNEEAYKIIDKIEAKFAEYDRRYDVYNDYCGICIEIYWGDWKHDHLFAKMLASEVLNALGLKYTITEQLTEEDGSDCYSAIHVIRVCEG